jgi:hypothetical protein
MLKIHNWYQVYGLHMVWLLLGIPTLQKHRYLAVTANTSHFNISGTMSCNIVTLISITWEEHVALNVYHIPYRRLQLDINIHFVLPCLPLSHMTHIFHLFPISKDSECRNTRIESYSNFCKPTSWLNYRDLSNVIHALLMKPRNNLSTVP